MTGNIKEAVRCYRETLMLDGYYDEAWIEIGIVVMMTGAYKGAIRLPEKGKTDKRGPSGNILPACISLPPYRKPYRSRKGADKGIEAR